MKKRNIKKIGTLFLAIIFIISMCISAFACDQSKVIGVGKGINIDKSLFLQQSVTYDGNAKTYNFKLVKGISFECTKMIYYKHGCTVPVTPIEPGSYDVEFIFVKSISVKVECALIIEITTPCPKPTCPKPTCPKTTCPKPTCPKTTCPKPTATTTTTNTTTTTTTTQAPTTTTTAPVVATVAAAKTTVINTTAVAKAAATKSNVLIAKTGDNSSLYIYTIIFSCSLAAIIFIGYKRHKEKMLNIE